MFEKDAWRRKNPWLHPVWDHHQWNTETKAVEKVNIALEQCCRELTYVATINYSKTMYSKDHADQLNCDNHEKPMM